MLNAGVLLLAVGTWNFLLVLRPKVSLWRSSSWTSSMVDFLPVGRDRTWSLTCPVVSSWGLLTLVLVPLAQVPHDGALVVPGDMAVVLNHSSRLSVQTRRWWRGGGIRG